MPNIAPIKGLIELQDDFTSQLGLAEAALGNFTKQNQESLKAVGIAAGLLVAAIGAVTYAVIELGKRGSDINDVEATLEHFAGGAKEAEAAMEALRQGTKNTVDNFILAKDAAHLLSTGVKLTAEDFGTLGQAAFVLQNRGLGDTKQQLELVSDALVTGRTRALAMSLGVIDAGDAEENFAKKLGITKDQLSDTGKVEAKRIQVMNMLRDAVKDAGEQERDFGEQIEAAKTQLSNWVDALASAIAKSPVFAAGFKAIENAVKGAFGGDSQEGIKKIVHFVEQAAIASIDFGQAAIVMAKIVESAWYAVKTAVLGTMAAIATTTANLLRQNMLVVVAATQIGVQLGVVSRQTADSFLNLTTQVDGMAQALREQTAEAAKTIVGHTVLDTALDKMSDTLGRVKAAMIAASLATVENTKTTNDAEKAAKAAAAAEAARSATMIDQAKVAAALAKSTKELDAIWTDYHKLVAERSGTSRDVQIADIEATFKKQVASLNETDPLYRQKYEAFKSIAHESLTAISTDWNAVRDKSLEGLEEMRDKALKTYEDMATGSLTFSRGALDEQYKKYLDLQGQVRDYGRAVEDSMVEAADSVKLLDHAWITDADIAAETINRTTVMVRTLSGEVISLLEAQRRQQAGFSYTVQAIDQYEIDRTPGGAAALLRELDTLSHRLETMRTTMRNVADQNAYFQALVRYNTLRDAYNLLISQANRNPRGFAEGGTVMVGEAGPEIVRLPLGATVYPNGSMPIPMGGGPGGSSMTFNNTWHVNGTGQQVAREVSDIIMRQLKQGRQFGAA